MVVEGVFLQVQICFQQLTTPRAQLLSFASTGIGFDMIQMARWCGDDAFLDLDCANVVSVGYRGPRGRARGHGANTCSIFEGFPGALGGSMPSANRKPE